MTYTATESGELREAMTRKPRTLWREAARAFVGNKGAMTGLFVVVLLIMISVMAPVLTPYDPLKVNMKEALHPPNGAHFMGTDQLGRDIFSRVLYGGRLSLPVGVVAVVVGVIGGMLMGLPAGYYGGSLDRLVMRLVDMMLAFPSILLALLVMAITGPGLVNVMVAVGVSEIPRYARVIRGCILSVKENTYVEAARAIGTGSGRIMVFHLLPNVVAPVVVMATLGVSGAILWGAALSFLGLGAQPPSPEWGSMVNSGRNYLSLAWWLTFFPGMALSLAILGINMMGDGLREALDPRLREV